MAKKKSFEKTFLKISHGSFAFGHGLIYILICIPIPFINGDIDLQYILKQWMVFFARSDWLLNQ